MARCPLLESVAGQQGAAGQLKRALARSQRVPKRAHQPSPSVPGASGPGVRARAGVPRSEPGRAAPGPVSGVPAKGRCGGSRPKSAGVPAQVPGWRTTRRCLRHRLAQRSIFSHSGGQWLAGAANPVAERHRRHHERPPRPARGAVPRSAWPRWCNTSASALAMVGARPSEGRVQLGRGGAWAAVQVQLSPTRSRGGAAQHAWPSLAIHPLGGSSVITERSGALTRASC